MIRLFRFFALFTVLSIFLSCSHYQVQKSISMADWGKMPKERLSVPLYAQYLKGVKVCLDPGHGGDWFKTNWKRGPKTGIREAAVNWRVGCFLRDMLEEAGATVIMTRNGDEETDLSRCVEIANENNADIFVSLHHNATSGPKPNYTTIWFHGDPDFEPAGLDLARQIQRGLEESLHLPQIQPRGLMSDFLMYQGAGFGVLRGLNCPGCLCESSFHSNPQEEERLANAWYNQREAYGIFMGIARYVASGLPSYKMVEPAEGSRVESKQPTLSFDINDGLSARGGWAAEKNWILQKSLCVSVDGKDITTVYDAKAKRAIGQVSEKLSNGEHSATVRFQNVHKNSAPVREQRFVVAPPAMQLVLKVEPDPLPAHENAWGIIQVEAKDADGEHVTDDTQIDFLATAGELMQATSTTKLGIANNYIRCPSGGLVTITAKSGVAETSHTLVIEPPKSAYLFGVITNAQTGKPVSGAEIVGVTPLATTTRDGRFAAASPGAKRIAVRASGLYSQTVISKSLEDGVSYREVKISSIGGGVMNRKSFVFDPRYGGSETGATSGDLSAAVCNLTVADALKSMLSGAGAFAETTRKENANMSLDDRIASANRYPKAQYIRIEHELAGPDGPSISALKPASSNPRYAKTILETASKYLGIKMGKVENDDNREFKETEGQAMAIVFHTLDQPEFVESGMAAKEAYAVYRGLLDACRAPKEGVRDLEIVVRGGQASATVFKSDMVILGGCEMTPTDLKTGTARFIGLPEGKSTLMILRGDKVHDLEDVDLSAGRIEIDLKEETPIKERTSLKP